MALPDTSILEAIEIPELWQPWFKDTNTWRSWRTFLRTLFGLPMDWIDLALFRECTERQEPAPEGYKEAWLICGRRAGKSFILALIACYLALFRDWRQYLVPGEVATIMVLARDRKQARTIFRYIRRLLVGVPALRQRVARTTAEVIELTGDIAIEVHTANYASVRGYTVIALLLDELAFWETAVDRPEADEEVIEAARPAMATVPKATMLVASSPYARRGALWNAYRNYWGKDDKPLIWKAPTRVMNPCITQEFVDAELARDPEANRAEYLAEFRDDVVQFVAREVVDALIIPDRYELPPLSGLAYTAFVDPSGGSADSMTLAIGHFVGAHDDTGILDLVREVRPPFSPENVVAEFAGVLRSYRIARVYGDRYAGEWPRERFREHGIEYEAADKTKSDLYRELLPLLNSGRVELLDHPRLAMQLCQLERRTARSGRDSIDHPPGGHDDVVNAVAGVLAGRSVPIVEITDAMLDAMPLLPMRRRW